MYQEPKFESSRIMVLHTKIFVRYMQPDTLSSCKPAATPVYASVYGDGPEPVVDAVGCIGTEDSLSQCSPIESGEFGPDTVSTVCKEGARSAGVVCSQGV